MVAEDQNDNMMEGFNTLKAWLKTKENLPQGVDDILLMRYVHCVKGDIERAKKILEKSFIMRDNSPHIFLDRDPLDPKTQKILNAIDMIPLPEKTADNVTILIYRLTQTDADLFEFNEVIKTFFMVGDARLAKTEANIIESGEIPIFDMAGFSLRHLTRVVLSTLRVYMKYTQEVHPVRLKHIHIINVTTFLDRLIMLIKPFIKKEVFKLIHFHLPNSETIYKFVPRENLPIEYGGTAGSLVDLKEKWIKEVESYRDYLMDGNRWRLNDSKKQNNCLNKESNTAIVKNFRSLEID